MSKEEQLLQPHTSRDLLDECLAEIRRLKSQWCDALGIAPEVSAVALRVEARLQAEIAWVTWDRVNHDETDIWFWWNGDHSFPVNIMKDHDGKFFASVGQWGWNRAQFLHEMGGLWFPCLCPVPSEPLRSAASG